MLHSAINWSKIVDTGSNNIVERYVNLCLRCAKHLAITFHRDVKKDWTGSYFTVSFT